MELQILLRDPVPSDFERMSMYARRVKVLGACLIYGVRRPSVAREQHRSYKISNRMWDMLAAHGPKPLLPNLLELHCTRARPHYDPTLPIEDCYPMGRHCSPKIFDFSLGAYPAAKRSAIDVVRSIARFAPNVRELHWFAREGPTDLNGPDLRNLSCLRKIAAKDVVVLPSALWALGTLPQLREVNTRLDFSKPEWNDLDVFPCGRTAALFPALEKLELEVVCILGIVAFIETITSTSLAYLKMKVRGGKMPDMLLTAFCSSIGNSPFRGTLRTLELDMQTGWWKPDPAFLYPTDSNSLRPLLSLQRLQTVSFNTDYPMVFIDDAFCHGISRSWPNIRVIEFHQITHGGRSYGWDEWDIDPEIGAPDCPKATLAGLIPLADHCLHLHKLEIPIDTRVRHKCFDPELNRIPPCNMGARGSRLYEFSAGVSVMGDPWEVASCLSLLFPFLERGDSGSTRKYAWDRMWKIYPQFVRIRRQEFRWRGRAEPSHPNGQGRE